MIVTAALEQAQGRMGTGAGFTAWVPDPAWSLSAYLWNILSCH